MSGYITSFDHSIEGSKMSGSKIAAKGVGKKISWDSVAFPRHEDSFFEVPAACVTMSGVYNLPQKK